MPRCAIGALLELLDNSWTRDLEEDPDSKPRYPNRQSRAVRGLWVRVEPTPLVEPVLVCYSRDMAARLRLTEDDVCSVAFLRFFAGDIRVGP